MLDLDFDRQAVPAKDASTLVLLRDRAAGGLEVFAVERHKKSGFLGGAIVFPGGKVDAHDAAEQWTAQVVPVADPRARALGAEGLALQALFVAACREALEEAAILPVSGGEADHRTLLALRAEAAQDSGALLRFLEGRGLRLDLPSLVPLARWVTPAAETRRFDTRFFAARLPAAQEGLHDDHETKASFWAAPAELLGRFARAEVELYPPTHRTLELLARFERTADALAFAQRSCLDPICPGLVRQGETLALTLPGDPQHPVREARVEGRSRYVLRGTQWLPEDAGAQ